MPPAIAQAQLKRGTSSKAEQDGGRLTRMRAGVEGQGSPKEPAVPSLDLAKGERALLPPSGQQTGEVTELVLGASPVPVCPALAAGEGAEIAAWPHAGWGRLERSWEEQPRCAERGAAINFSAIFQKFPLLMGTKPTSSHGKISVH